MLMPAYSNDPQWALKDLGGGTFEVSILTIDNGIFEAEGLAAVATGDKTCAFVLQTLGSRALLTVLHHR